MFQLTYKIQEPDQIIHQISQFGAQFLSKGPETETFYAAKQHQLKLEEGITSELVIIKVVNNYQQLDVVDVNNARAMKEILAQALGERAFLTKQVIRYHLKNVLIEIHRYEKIGALLHLRAESVEPCLNLARQLNLGNSQKTFQTSADIICA